MYEKVSGDLNFVDREKKVEEFWAKNQIFEKSRRSITKDERAYRGWLSKYR